MRRRRHLRESFLCRSQQALPPRIKRGSSLNGNSGTSLLSHSRNFCTARGTLSKSQKQNQRTGSKRGSTLDSLKRRVSTDCRSLFFLRPQVLISLRSTRPDGRLRKSSQEHSQGILTSEKSTLALLGLLVIEEIGRGLAVRNADGFILIKMGLPRRAESIH